MSVDQSVCQQVASWLAAAERCVAFTGAGISTESGIPDFRSPGGVWARNEPVYYQDFLASAESRHEYWRQKCEAHRDFAEAQPNAAHRVLAQWEQSGKLRAVITQNIDELHQLGGSRRVLELHGTARKIGCIDCSRRFDVEAMTVEFQATNQVPPCPECGGRLKHATVSFGQSLPEAVLSEAIELCQSADLIFALGSSLVVEPAASLPRVAKQNGGRLVIINRDRTGLDGIADAVLNSSTGKTLSAIAELLDSGK